MTFFPVTLQETVARSIHFAVSKLSISCQYKLVTGSALVPFPAWNAFGRTQTAVVIVTEEALEVLLLIASLLFVTGMGTLGKEGHGWVVGRGFCYLDQGKQVLELCKVKMLGRQHSS